MLNTEPPEGHPELKGRNKAHKGAWKKGWRARKLDKPKTHNPYGAAAILSRSFWKAWNQGWEAAA